MKTRQPCSGLRPAALVTVAALAACTDTNPVSPTRSQPVAPSYSTQPALQGEGPRHVLLMRGQGGAIPSDLLAAVAVRGGTVQWSEPEIGVVTTSGLSDAAAAELAARPDVDGINRDLEVRWLPPGDGLMSAAIEAPSAEAAQTGAEFFTFFQWNMRQIRADAAWRETDRGDGALVCILDTGIDPEHLDLVGKVDLAKSTSFVPTEPFLDDRNTHGTFVAALVASNGIGIASVAPAARLCAVKVLDETGEGPFAGVIAGMIHAARMGADVINVSLGAYISMKEPGARGLVRALQRAVDFATRQGALVVAAAGNDGINLDRDPRDFIHVPSQLDDVLSVGATAPFDQTNFDALTSYTNFGRTGVDVVAPGGDLLAGGQLRDLILSACSHFQTQLDFQCSTTSYVLGSGTSFAAPHVAGAAALLAFERRSGQMGERRTGRMEERRSGQIGARRGGQMGQRLSECVIDGADDLGRPGLDHRYGRGRLNVLGTVKCRRHRVADDD